MYHLPCNCLPPNYKHLPTCPAYFQGELEQAVIDELTDLRSDTIVYSKAITEIIEERINLIQKKEGGRHGSSYKARQYRTL